MRQEVVGILPRGLLLLLAVSVMLCFQPNRLAAQEASRPLPANTAPGVVKTEIVDGQLVFYSLEIDGWSPFQILQDLPLSEIKGDRTNAETTRFGCYPATGKTACLIDAILDGEREFWFFRRVARTEEMVVAQIPDRAVSDQFWTSPIASLVGRGPLSFVALPEKGDVPAKVWVESTDGGVAFHSYELPRNDQYAMARPSFNGDALSGLFLLLSRSGERYLTPSEGIEILAADADGAFATYAIPPNCEVLGAINDAVICGENTRGNSSPSLAPPYPRIMQLNLPEGTEEDITRNNQSPAFHALGGSIIVRGMTAGIARPYIQSIDGPALPALYGEKECIKPYEHVDVFEVTATGASALMRVVSPLDPTRLILAPIENGRIQICSSAAQLYREEHAEQLDHSAFKIEQRASRVSTDVPYTLVYKDNEGPLSGHLLAITYPHAAVWLPEGYLGPWLTEWVSDGGKVAFVHLPGGGGYGAKWSSQGFGIRNKIEVSRLFDEVTADLIDTGLSEEGKVSVLTESGGGTVMADAILRNPSRYAVFALRAACLAIEGDTRKDCGKFSDYGNWYDEQDRELMDQFEPIEKIVRADDFPAIAYGLPDSDQLLSLTYQNRMLRQLADKDLTIFNVAGADHTDRSAPEVETQWVRLIASLAQNTE